MALFNYHHQPIRSKLGIVCLSLKVLPFFLLMELAFFGRITNAINIVNVTAQPDRVKDLLMDTDTCVSVSGYAYLTQEEVKLGLNLCSQVTDLEVARPLHQICSNRTLELEPILPFDTNSHVNPFTSDLYFFNGSFYLYGVLLGRTSVKVYVNESLSAEVKDHDVVLIEKYSVTVIRKPRFLDHLFTGTIAVFVIFINIGFGCMIDLKVIKEILKKPIVPLLGLCCQYIINPLMAYGLLKALSLNTAFSFGMFAFGCSPSGSASNAWTVILKGDLDLSLFVTFASTVAALGMMPLWLFTIGKTLVSETIQIPYTNIMISLVSLIVPVLIGVIIHRFLPKVSKFLIRLVKPASALFLLYVCTFGLYVNSFMFKLLNWKVLVAGLTMPFCTFTLGAIVAGICKLSYKRIITIAIETAIQNTGIALVMMLATLPKPDGDIAAIMPIAGSVFTPLPLLVVLTGSYIHRKCTSTEKKNMLMISGKDDCEIKNITSDTYQNNNFMNSCPT